MRNRHAILSISVILLAAVGGCDRDQGPAEQAGEKIDQAVEETGQQLEQATEQAGQKLEEAGDRLREGTSQ